MADNPAYVAPHRSAKVWLFRTLAIVAIPAASLAVLEGALRLCGYGRSVRFLVPDQKPGYCRTNPEFVSSFLPSSFDLRPLNWRIAVRKPPGALRVVVLGESAAQGIPAPPFGFAAQLRAQLRARFPGRDIEVFNTGIVAIDSHVVVEIAREFARFSPDIFVVYMGNNEVVGPYGPGCAYLSAMPPRWLIRLSVFVKATRTGQLLGAAIGHLARNGRRPAEWGGMAMFVNNAVRGDDPRLAAVYRNFEANLRDIVRAAADCGAQTVLCTVVSNLKDCAPFLSVHRAGMSDGERAQWTAAFTRGRIERLLGYRGAAERDLEAAERIDPDYADTAFLLGRLALDRGDTATARRRFIQAEHWDALRFRPDPEINAAIRRVAREFPGVRLVDAALELGSDPASTAPPAGRELLFEHVHFDWTGNFRLARMIAEACAPGGPFLRSPECAEAIGYTEHERYSVLQHIGTVTRHPPFTNQITYCEDQARYEAELASAQAARGDARTLQHADAVVTAAIARDPANPDLPKIAEDVADDRGDLRGALAYARLAETLQPANSALAADEAIKLIRLGDPGQAGALLRATARTCDTRDLALMAPAFADLFIRTRRFAEATRYFDEEIARTPGDSTLRILRARLLQLSGDDQAAARGLRAVLTDDPGNQAALEALIDVLAKSGRQPEADAAALDGARAQPGDFENDLRAAVLYDRQGDEREETRCLLAAASNGPVTAGVELRIAKGLFDEGRPDEAMLHLAQAERVSLYAGNPAATAQIRRVIGGIIGRAAGEGGSPQEPHANRLRD